MNKVVEHAWLVSAPSLARPGDHPDSSDTTIEELRALVSSEYVKPHA